MKNYKEFMEAVLAGEILYKAITDIKMKLCPTTLNISLKSKDGVWVENVCWYFPDIAEWEILPKTININGIEVPEPVRKPLAHQQNYYLLAIYREVFYCSWLSTEQDYMWLNQGLIHLTKEAAIIHRDALLSFTQK